MMRRYLWQVLASNKYYHLLAVLVAFFFIVPFGTGGPMQHFVFPLMFLSGILFSLRALEVKRAEFLFMALTGVSALAIGILFEFVQAPAAGCRILLEIPIVIYALFLLMSIALLISKMFAVSKVTSDTIAGGISVYLLLGFLWTVFYYAVYIYDPCAFNFPSPSHQYSLFYSSFSTLTTVGYGDISPVNRMAMSLSNLEAITGQMYVAIFISRLVGLHIAAHNK